MAKAGQPEPPRDPAESDALGPPAVWAPWRLPYLEAMSDEPESDRGDQASGATSQSEQRPPSPQPACFLSAYWASPQDDIENHVLVRTDRGMILLNRYPYSNGHLLVALGEGRPRLLDYDPEDRAALWALVDRAADLMERAIGPQGINIGVNQGRAAGAGVPQHLHAHLVPRWGGDVNFISTVGGVRVIPSALDAMAQRYRAVLDR